MAAALAAAAGVAAAAPAAAHVQVRPVRTAPGDVVLWTVLAPSERDAGTRAVELAVPQGVLAYSFEDAAGWTRRLRMRADGSVRSIVWRGRTRADGLATFRFLASTPEREGAIAWKAVQTYRDGVAVRWIGSAESQHPAATTIVSRAGSREDPGGDGDGGAGAGGGAAPTAIAAGGADGADWLARGLAAAALLAAASTAMISVRRSP
jgi:uncharacterized protein YcnI